MRVVKISYTMACPLVREIIHSLLASELCPVQTDKPWFNYYLAILFAVAHCCVYNPKITPLETSNRSCSKYKPIFELWLLKCT